MVRQKNSMKIFCMYQEYFAQFFKGIKTKYVYIYSKDKLLVSYCDKKIKIKAGG